MPFNRKLLGAAAFCLALAGGGAAGALLGTPDITGAQDNAEATRSHPGKHMGEGVATAAEAIGISEEDLRAELADGKSVAQVAEEHGVDVEMVVDALVASATDRLEEEIDGLPDRMTDLVNRDGLPDKGRHGRPGGGHPRAKAAGLKAAAEAIGITPAELATEVRGGSTIAEVVEANDVDVQSVINAMVEEANAHIDEAVEKDRLSEEQADRLKAELDERITARVNG